MANDRFDHLEKATLPDSVQEAISRLDRFGHLELAKKTDAPPPTPVPAMPSRLLCPHCHQANEAVRDYCWACFHPLRAAAPSATKPSDEQEIQLLLDGVSYRSSDPALPDDVKALMERIRSQGFSQQLLTDWKAWKKNHAAPVPPAPVAPSPGAFAPDPRVEAFQGARLSILRLDGVLYKSDDENLPPEIKEILDYIERDGVTPALMQHLRLYGTKVKFRPLSAVNPSDGDVDFWNSAKKFINQS